jgi:hypothetical protein
VWPRLLSAHDEQKTFVLDIVTWSQPESAESTSPSHRQLVIVPSFGDANCGRYAWKSCGAENGRCASKTYVAAYGYSEKRIGAVGYDRSESKIYAAGSGCSESRSCVATAVRFAWTSCAAKCDHSGLRTCAARDGHSAQSFYAASSGCFVFESRKRPQSSSNAHLCSDPGQNSTDAQHKPPGL